MTEQLSREIVENLLQHNDESDSPANAEAWEVNALCRMLLAGMDSEQVAVPDMLWKMEHWRGAPCNGVEWAKGYQAGWNKYHQWLGERRAAMLKAGPVTGWIKCSERMPPSKTAVIVGCWFGRNWATKWATYLPGHEDAQKSGFLMPGGSWTPTHWMPLPAAPEQEV